MNFSCISGKVVYVYFTWMTVNYWYQAYYTTEFYNWYPPPHLFRTYRILEKKARRGTVIQAPSIWDPRVLAAERWAGKGQLGLWERAAVRWQPAEGLTEKLSLDIMVHQCELKFMNILLRSSKENPHFRAIFNTICIKFYQIYVIVWKSFLEFKEKSMKCIQIPTKLPKMVIFIELHENVINDCMKLHHWIFTHEISTQFPPPPSLKTTVRREHSAVSTLLLLKANMNMNQLYIQSKIKYLLNKPINVH